MWDITFPKTPEGEKELVIYYHQKTKEYIKLTLRGNVLVKYIWDGIATSFTDVEIDAVVKHLLFTPDDKQREALFT